MGLARHIYAKYPDAVIISNLVRPEQVPGAELANHITIQGSDAYTGRFLTPIFIHPGVAEYRQCLIEDALLRVPDFAKVALPDCFDQTLGRTLGHRYRDGSRACAFLSPKMWSVVGHLLRRCSRYRVKLVDEGAS